MTIIEIIICFVGSAYVLWAVILFIRAALICAAESELHSIEFTIFCKIQELDMCLKYIIIQFFGKRELDNIMTQCDISNSMLDVLRRTYKSIPILDDYSEFMDNTDDNYCGLMEINSNLLKRSISNISDLEEDLSKNLEGYKAIYEKYIKLCNIFICKHVCFMFEIGDMEMQSYDI